MGNMADGFYEGACPGKQSASYLRAFTAQDANRRTKTGANCARRAGSFSG